MLAWGSAKWTKPPARSGRRLRCSPATRPEMPRTRRKREMSREQLRRLTETAIAVALVAVLSNVKVYQLPQGGSITAGSMVPIFYIALRWGGPRGLLGGGRFLPPLADTGHRRRGCRPLAGALHLRGSVLRQLCPQGRKPLGVLRGL